jgi:hypothetical protein
MFRINSWSFTLGNIKSEQKMETRRITTASGRTAASFEVIARWVGDRLFVDRGNLGVVPERELRILLIYYLYTSQVFPARYYTGHLHQYYVVYYQSLLTRGSMCCFI